MNKKHSPLKNRPLRYAGQSLDEKIQDIVYDDVLPGLLICAMLVVVAVIEWSERIFKTPPTPWFWTIIAVVAIVYYSKKLFGSWKKLQNYKLGRDGERIVCQSLENLRSLGYRVINDIIDKEKGFNIDHILIGPAGVFTIETKTMSKSGGVQKVQWDGNKIKIDGFKPHRNPITQAKAQAYWLQDFILETTGISIRVKPVVIYPGWFVEPQPRGAEVWVLNEKALPAFIKNEETVIDQDKINLISIQIGKFNQEIK